MCYQISLETAGLHHRWRILEHFPFDFHFGDSQKAGQHYQHTPFSTMGFFNPSMDK